MYIYVSREYYALWNIKWKIVIVSDFKKNSFISAYVMKHFYR